jgi:hypothetical protein
MAFRCQPDRSSELAVVSQQEKVKGQSCKERLL